MDTILKVECDGDLRRALLKGTPSYVAIDRAVKEIWPGCSADGARYMDDEGDSCTLKEQTFPDFLATAKAVANGSSLLRLQLSPSSAQEAAADSAAVPESASEAFSRPWEHVAEGSEAGEDHLHTVADLTDVHEDEDIPQEQAAAAATDSEHLQPAPAVQESLVGTEEVSKDDVEQDDARGRAESAGSAVSFDIHTPTHTPRGGGAETMLEDALAEEALASEIQQGNSETSATFNGYQVHRFVGKPAEAPFEAQATGPQTSTDHNASASSSDEPLIIDHDVDEKIDIVLAAFDENGDGHLNFTESNALHHAAWGGQLSLEVFQQMCADEGEDPDAGLGREALMCIYSRCRTLERDFEAAKAKLEGAAAADAERANRRREEAAQRPINLMLQNPLLAVPFALDATERLRQGVARSLTGRR